MDHQWIRNWLDGHTQRLVVNGLMSKGRPVTSSIPQGLVFGLALFNIFIDDMNGAVECTLSKFDGDTKLCGAVDTPEGWVPSRETLTGFEKCSCGKIMKFHKARCKVLHMSRDNPKHNYRLAQNGLRAALSRRTWGCWLMRSST